MARDPAAGRLYLFLRFLARCVARLYFRHRASGLENIPAEGPFLLAVNHASHLDPVLAGIEMKRALFFIARRSLFEIPIFGRIISKVNAVPIDREGVSKETIRVVLGELNKGHGVLIFPEGTRSRDGELGKFRGGATRIAQMANVPLVPAYLQGTNRALGRGAWFPRPIRTSVHYGEPLRLERREDSDKANEILRQRIEALVEAQKLTKGRDSVPVG